MRYRKKPVEIDAVQFTGWNFFTEITDFCPDAFLGPRTEREVFIRTLEGTMHVAPGDFVIRGVVGEFYPCKPDIFWATYEAV